MTTKFIDAVSIGGTKRTEDGYLIASAKSVRTGIQIYAGWEVGRPQMDAVRVYRSPEEVFAQDSLQSFSHAPVTNLHPDEQVTADNWAEYSVGEVSTAAKRDGEWVELPLILKDAKAIKAVESGRRELSAGYTCDLAWESGVTADGQEYDARQVGIKINHLALVNKARAGSQARIGDGVEGGESRKAWGASPLTVANDHDEKGVSAVTEKTTSITRDGLPVTMPEAAAPIVNKWLSDADKALEAKDAQIAAKDAELAKKDAEIDDLKGKVMDAATLDAAVQKRADLIDAAKKIAPKIETKGIADAEIRKAAVVAVRGADAVADKSAAYIDAAFDLLVDNAKEQKQPNPLSGMVASAQSTNDGDPEALRAAAHKSYLDGLNGVQAQKGA